MPEMTFTVRWPDGSTHHHRSPSLVVHDHLDTGTTYPVAEFVARSAQAMREASDRVRARYGMACTAALATADEIASLAERFDPDDGVEVLRLHPPLPAQETS